MDKCVHDACICGNFIVNRSFDLACDGWMIRFIGISTREPNGDKVSLVRIGINAISHYDADGIKMSNGDKYWMYGDYDDLGELLDEIVHGDAYTTVFLRHKEFRYISDR